MMRLWAKIERGLWLWRRAGDEFGTGHSLNEERKREETQPDYQGWVEIRARGHSRLWRRRRSPMEECGDESTRHSQPWRRRKGKNGKMGVERGREQVEQEGRKGTNGKMGWEGETTGRIGGKRGNKWENGLRWETTGSQFFFFFSFFLFLLNG